MGAIIQMPSPVHLRLTGRPITAQRVEAVLQVQQLYEKVIAALYADLPNAKFPVRVGRYRINDRKRPASVIVME